MAGVAAAEFAADLWISALPETGQIGRHLHGTLIGREQMDHDGHAARPEARRFLHAEEILQARGDPWCFAGFVMNLDLPTGFEP